MFTEIPTTWVFLTPERTIINPKKFTFNRNQKNV